LTRCVCPDNDKQVFADTQEANKPLNNDAYIYQDGSHPSTQQLQRLKQFSFAVPIQTLAQLIPHQAGILTKGQNQQQTSQIQVIMGL